MDTSYLKKIEPDRPLDLTSTYHFVNKRRYIMKKSSLIAIILIVLLAFIGVFFFLKHRAATNKNINSTTETTQKKNSKIINLNEKNFESTIKKTKEPLLVCFSASWCSYCQKEKPILKKLANEKNSKFKIAIIDTDENQALAQKQGIMGLPTHVVFYGGKEKERISSFLDEQKIKNLMSDYVKEKE